MYTDLVQFAVPNLNSSTKSNWMTSLLIYKEIICSLETKIHVTMNTRRYFSQL